MLYITSLQYRVTQKSQYPTNKILYSRNKLLLNIFHYHLDSLDQYLSFLTYQSENILFCQMRLFNQCTIWGKPFLSNMLHARCFLFNVPLLLICTFERLNDMLGWLNPFVYLIFKEGNLITNSLNYMTGINLQKNTSESICFNLEYFNSWRSSSS